MARSKAATPGYNGIAKNRRQPRSSLNRIAAFADDKKRRGIAAVMPTYIFTSESGARGEVLKCEPPVQDSDPGPDPSTRTKPLHSQPASQRHTHVFFLPGNPGIIEFYRRWMFELARILPFDVRSTLTFHALGLPGHDVRELNSERVFLIDDHCDYVKSYLHSPQVSPPLPTSQVIFVGHSYGAYLALRVLNHLPDVAARANYIMLMPAVWEMGACRTPDIRLLTDGTLSSIMIPVANSLASVLPHHLKQRFISSFASEEGSELVLSRMMDGRRSSLFNNILSLARCEAREIHDPQSEPAAAMLGPDRSYLYWTDNDIWCTAESVQAIKNAFGDLTVQHAGQTPPVKHAFSLNVPQLEAVAKTVASWITAICRQ